jgi:hypothetical protein
LAVGGDLAQRAPFAAHRQQQRGRPV